MDESYDEYYDNHDYDDNTDADADDDTDADNDQKKDNYTAAGAAPTHTRPDQTRPKTKDQRPRTKDQYGPSPGLNEHPIRAVKLSLSQPPSKISCSIDLARSQGRFIGLK